MRSHFSLIAKNCVSLGTQTLNKYVQFDICYPMSVLASRLTADKVSIIFRCLGLLSDCNLYYYKLITSVNYIQIIQSVMPKPVYLLTVQEAHKEYNSLTDQIQAKLYEQLDSGEFGAVGTPAFNAEACELANLLAHVSQLCQKLNLPPPEELYRPTFFKH